jgi:hypothetical protein
LIGANEGQRLLRIRFVALDAVGQTYRDKRLWCK